MKVKIRNKLINSQLRTIFVPEAEFINILVMLLKHWYLVRLGIPVYSMFSNSFFMQNLPFYQSPNYKRFSQFYHV